LILGKKSTKIGDVELPSIKPRLTRKFEDLDFTLKRNEVIMPIWCPGTITERTVWTHGLFTIRVRAPDVLPFLPGQFLQLGVYISSQEGSEMQELGGKDGAGEGAGKWKLINRPYSVASPHGEYLEFFIVLVEDGELTPHLWNLKVNDSIQVSQKGAGSFTLEKAPPAENLWLLGTGTGLAPYIAMVRDPLIWEKYQQVVIVHGVRQADDLAYTDELRQLETRFPNRFRFFQTLTRERQQGFLHGRIPQLVADGTLEKLTGCPITRDNATVMLCGNPAMLDSMEELLSEREMRLHRSKNPGQIVLERYW